MCSNINKKGKYDVLVAGGGVAGAAAALEASRSGKKVVLIEKSTQLGGLATIGLINLFVPMCNGRGVQIIKGMAEEFLRLSIKYGFDTIPGDWKNGEPGFGKTEQRYITRYSAPIFSLALTEILTENNVDIKFDTVITGADVTDGHINGITVYNKSGYEYYEADMIVDASGDADVLHLAGVPTVTGGNFDTYIAFYTNIGHCAATLESEDIAKLVGKCCGGGADLYGKGHPEGMPLWDGTNGDDVSEYLKSNQLKLLNNIKNEDRTKRDITLLPIMPQFRTTRRIDGDYTLKTEDAYKHFDDSIGAICDFERKDFLFEMPYRTMIKTGFDNVIAAGRVTSGEGYAWDVLRVIPPAIITGQVAGAACAQAIDSNKPIYNIDVSVLQNKLEKENVIIHFDDTLVPEDKEKSETVDIGHI